ncbi:MAG: hypothetical protein JO212_15655 [Acetobacteraceae bacterium]|nr:hypothetical protein [Acetobacteraceae bacterium]
MDLDPRIANRADGDREGQTLQQGEVDMHVEPLCLKSSEARGDGLEALAHRIEMVQSLLEVEIGKVLETSSLRNKVENFSYCFRKAFLK